MDILVILFAIVGEPVRTLSELFGDSIWIFVGIALFFALKSDGHSGKEPQSEAY